MHGSNRVWFLIALAVAVGSSGAMALREPPQPASAVVDVAKVGPRVGETVPDFSLTDQHGTTRSLKSVMGPKGAILVFFRSADW
jgi:hypothetical protein